MRVVSHPEAEQELEAAALWYDERQPGLGEAFLDEFQPTLRRILADPQRWHAFRRDNRKHNPYRFPYAVVYRFGANQLHVVAVMHLHRRPSYWAHR